MQKSIIKKIIMTDGETIINPDVYTSQTPDGYMVIKDPQQENGQIYINLAFILRVHIEITEAEND